MRNLSLRSLWITGGVILVVAIIYLSLMPSPGGLMPQALNDKSGHVIAYFVLMLWFAGFWQRRWHLRLAAVFFALGMGMEFLQGFIELRVSEGLDMVANGLGVGLGLLLARLGLDGWCGFIERLLGRAGSADV